MVDSRPRNLRRRWWHPDRGFAVADLNRDGRFDIVTPDSREIAVMLGTRSKNIAFAAPIRLPVSAPFALALLDINGDSQLDIVAASDDDTSLVQTFLDDAQASFKKRRAHDSAWRQAARTLRWRISMAMVCRTLPSVAGRPSCVSCSVGDRLER